MTASRRIPMEKTTFAICRRVNERRFLLRPDARLTQLFVWLLGMVAGLFEIEVHAATVMSTHFHLVISSSGQRVSKFMEVLNANLAKAVNVLRRLPRGIVWEPGTLSIVELETPEAIVEAIAYAIVNPVAAGLVWQPSDWPGLSVQVEQIGRVLRRERRPGFFFRKGWSEWSELQTVMPEWLVEHYGEEGARAELEAAVERLVHKAHAQVKAKRWRVAGAIAAANAPPLQRAKSWEDFGALCPRVAAGPGQREARVEAIERLVRFHQEYRDAWKRYMTGERDVVFPYGTYLMRVRHNVRVAPGPS